jgi:hypothetical protein
MVVHMEYGTYTKLANEAGAKVQFIWRCLQDPGQTRNAAAPIAKRLAAVTDTDITLWLREGDPAERREAVQRWWDKVAGTKRKKVARARVNAPSRTR